MGDVLDVFAVYCLVFVVTGLLLLKGKPGMAALNFLVPAVGSVVGLIGLARLARPDSWWAHRRYGSLEMSAARERYPNADDAPEPAFSTLAWVVMFVLGPAVVAIGLLAQ